MMSSMTTGETAVRADVGSANRTGSELRALRYEDLHTGRSVATMKRITISVPDDVAEKAANAVANGDAPSVSAWFSRLARREPDWVAAKAVMAELAAEAGVTDDDRAWARAALRRDAQDGAA